MIKIKCGSKEQVIVPTIFPDGISQVWKIDAEQYRDKAIDIVWNYENEVEILHLLQLRDLLIKYNVELWVLYIPYFPYARQDKATTDESTFARSTFVDIIDRKFDTIITSDIHSPLESDYCEFIDEKPTQYIKSAIIDFNTDILVFPDAGAYYRYGEIFPEYNYIVLDKVRNQLTGKIESLEINKKYTTVEGSDESYKFLIIDDLSDYGGTFKMTSKFLHEQYNCDIALYVTHFLGHGGVQHIIDSGISKIYTTNSLTSYRGLEYNGDNLTILVKHGEFQ